MEPTIGENIRIMRLRARVSQEALAAKTDGAMTRILVSSTESGDRSLKMSEVPGLCKALGITINELVDGVPEFDGLFQKHKKKK